MKIIKAGAAVAVVVSVGLFFLGSSNVVFLLLVASVLFVLLCQMALVIVYRNLASRRKKDASLYINFEDTVAGKLSGFLFGYVATASVASVASVATEGAFVAAGFALLMSSFTCISWLGNAGIKRIFYAEAAELNEIFVAAQKAREKVAAEKARREKAEMEAKAERDEKERQAKEKEKTRQAKAALDEAMRRADSF